MRDRTFAADLACALRETLRPLERATGLPAACYADPALHALEQHALFGRHWLALAREEDLPEPGSFVTRAIGRERVLIVRGADGVLRAFFNVCRHRGSRLVEEASGRLNAAIVCPYHAWSYELDGRLRHAPQLDIVRASCAIAAQAGIEESAAPAPNAACAAIDASSSRTHAFALAAMPLGVAHGFVFACCDSAAAPLADTLADLPDWSRFGLGQLRRVQALEYAVAANWKLVCENYSECYHCPRAHPQLDRLCEISAGGFECGRGFNGGPMQLRAGFDTLSMSGASRWLPLCAADSARGERLVYYYLVYPNLMLGIHPDYLAVHAVWPRSESSSRVVCEIFVPAATLALAGFDPAEVVEFWDLTNRQDWALCERVQHGIGSRGYLPGPYAPSERCVHAFDCWYAQWLLQALEPRCA